MEKRRVLILTADTGSGHRSVSKALRETAELGGERLELVEFDPLIADDPLWSQSAKFVSAGREIRGDSLAIRTLATTREASPVVDGSPRLRLPATLERRLAAVLRGSGRLQSENNGRRPGHPNRSVLDPLVKLYGPLVVHAPWLWGLTYEVEALPGMQSLYQALYGPTLRRRIAGAIDLICPDAVISVHPLINHALAKVRDTLAQQRRWLPTMTVVTDLVDIHPWWVCPAIDQFAVSTNEARSRVLALGVDPHRVTVTGQPIKPSYATIHRDSQEMRARLQLRDIPTVLFMGGGDGSGGIVDIVSAADRHVRRRGGIDAQYIVVCGRNTRAQIELAARSWAGPTVVLGHVDNIQELMVAADVLVTKPGPSTIAEACAIGRPMLVGPGLPGQERSNGPWVVRSGAGLSYRTPREAGQRVFEMLSDPQAMAVFRAQAHRLRHPDASQHVLNLVARAIRSGEHLSLAPTA